MERVSPWELEPEQADAAPRGDEARRAEEAASRAARASALAVRRCAQTLCVLPPARPARTLPAAQCARTGKVFNLAAITCTGCCGSRASARHASRTFIRSTSHH